MTTDSFVVKPIRFPGGSIGELAVNGTVNDLAVAGRAAAGAEPLAGARGGPRRRRPARRGGGDRRRGRRGRGGDRRRRHQGRRARPRRRHVRLHRPASASRDPRAPLSPAALRPGDRVIVSGTIGEHGTAIMLARGEFELDADDRVRHALAVAGRRRAARSGRARTLRCMRDATRGGVASVLNELARASGVGDGGARGRRAGDAGGRRAPRRCSGSTRCTWPTRASSWPSSPPSGRTRRWRRCARSPGCEEAAEIGEVTDGAAGDGAGGDGLRRQAGDGSAGRRSAARIC